MSFLLKHYRPDNLAAGAIVGHSLAIANGLIAAFKALQFPVCAMDPETDLWALTGIYVQPKVSVCQTSERFEGTRQCTVLGKTRSQWLWEARLRFNNLVVADHIFREMALEPITVVSPPDLDNAIDPESKAFLVSTKHNWRPSQDAGPGSSFDLQLEIR